MSKGKQSIPPQLFQSSKKIVNRLLHNSHPTEITNVDLMGCIVQLDKDLTYWYSIKNKLQRFLKNTDNIQLKTAQKLVNAPIDFQKSIELAEQKYSHLVSEINNKKGKVDVAERIKTIINFMTELNFGQIQQQNHKGLLNMINSSKYLQSFDKEILEATSKKMLDYEISLRKIQGDAAYQLTYIKKFVNTASNPKFQVEDLKKQFQSLPKIPKEIMNPLVSQLLKAKSSYRALVDQLLSQKAKLKHTKLVNQTQAKYELRQNQISSLLEEARIFKFQNERIKIVLGELANMTKMMKKEQVSQGWQTQRRIQINQVKQENKIYLTTLFEHILSLKNTSPQKNVYLEQYDLKKQKVQTNNLSQSIKQLKVQNDKLNKQLFQGAQRNNQLKALLQKANAKIEEGRKQISNLQIKLRQNQGKLKSLEAETKTKLNQYASSGTRSQTELKRIYLKLEQDHNQLKKKYQQLEQDQNQLISQYDTLYRQKQQLESSCLSKENLIKDLESRLKAYNGNKANNQQEVERYTTKMRKQVSDYQQNIDELRQQLTSAKKQNKELERQFNQVLLGGNPENGKENNKNDSIVSALRQNDRINKETISKLKKQHSHLINEVRTYKNQLQQLTTEFQALRKYSEQNTMDLSKLESFEKQLIQSESNYNQLNHLYTQLRNQVQQEKNKGNNCIKAGEQFRQKVVEDLSFQLKQKDLDVQRFTQKFLKQTAERDHQIAQLKIEIGSKNTQIERLKDTSDVSKLNKKTTDLQKELELLAKENYQLKINLQRKEREVMQIQINKIDQRK